MAQLIERTLSLSGRGETVVQEAAGPPGAPTLVMLHGLGATGSLNWGPCFRQLSSHFRVLCVDHRGHGRGLRTRRFRLEECADDAAAIAEACGAERFIPVGYSMGGPIASLLWRRHRGRVRGLVLCATARHFASPRAAPFARLSLSFAAALSRGLPDLTQRRMRERMLARIEHEPLRQKVTRELAGHDPTTVIQASRSLMGFSSHDWIGEVDVPSAVLMMTRDEMVPPERQRRLAESIPGAALYPIEADHLACSTRAEVFVPTLLEACREVDRRGK